MINKVLIKEKINNTFKNRERNRIAKQCLELATEWDSKYHKLDPAVKSSRTYLDNFNCCYQYIVDNFDKSKVKTFSIWAIILPTIISYVAKWVTQWVIDLLEE
jgi:hypothetical protein|tara:strand:+ start:222 stop:530 length:309 start_codon:yes stop_codon:yes gene_type:complete